MKAEFRSESLEELPDLVVTTEDEDELRALQLFMKLMDQGLVRFQFEYLPPETEDDETEGEIS